MYGDCPAQIFLGLVIWCLFELAREVGPVRTKASKTARRMVGVI